MRWELEGKRSVFYPIFQNNLKDEFQKVIKEQVTPWAFMTTSYGLKVKKFDGSQITISGGEFSGSPELIFWSDDCIEPFLKHISSVTIEDAVKRCTAQNTKLKPVLKNVQELLSLGFLNVYQKMANVDRRLRGKGYPNRVELRDIDVYITKMDEFVARRIDSEIKLWKPFRKRLQHLYNNNKWFFKLLGSIITLLALIFAILEWLFP
ncbi:MAG: hypothetical protein PVG03_12220 [Desulfarculaceae bacterium]